MTPYREQELREQVAKVVLSQFYSGSAEYTAERIADALLPLFRVREAETVEQCAIEAGERSPEGVSSHTMLGDMWDERIRAALAAAKEKVK